MANFLKLTTDDAQELYLLGYDATETELLGFGYVTNDDFAADTIFNLQPEDGGLRVALKEDLKRGFVVVAFEDKSFPLEQRESYIRLELFDG